MKLSLNLSGISLSDKNDIFSYEISDHSENSRALKKWLQITLKKNYIDSVSEKLIFDINFKPMKPFK